MRGILRGVLVQDGAFALAGLIRFAEGSSAAPLFVSTDGTSWIQSDLLPTPPGHDAFVNRLAATPIGFIAIGAHRPPQTNPDGPEQDWDAALWIRGEDRAWTLADEPVFRSGLHDEFRDVVVVGSELIAVGFEFPVFEPKGFQNLSQNLSNAAVWVWSDTGGWERVPDSGNFSSDDLLGGLGKVGIYAAVAANGSIYAFGEFGFGRGLAIWVSEDGRAWDLLDPEGARIISGDLGINDAIADPRGIVVVGWGQVGHESLDPGAMSPVVWWSPDGDTWIRPDIGAYVGSLESVTATEHGFIAVGRAESNGKDEPLALASPDGLFWYPMDWPDVSGAMTEGRFMTIEATGDEILLAAEATMLNGQRGLVAWTGTPVQGVVGSAYVGNFADVAKEAATEAAEGRALVEESCPAALEIYEELDGGSPSQEQINVIAGCERGVLAAEDAAERAREAADNAMAVAPDTEDTRRAVTAAEAAEADATAARIIFDESLQALQQGP